MVYLPAPLYRKETDKIYGEKHANNNRAEMKSYLLAVKPERNSEEEVPADLNSFQLWARWCYTKHCSKERWWGLQTQQDVFASTHDTWLQTPTSSAHSQSIRILFWSCAKEKRDPFGQEELHRDAPRQSREVKVWPFSYRVWIIITLCTPATTLGQHLGIYQNSVTAKTLWGRNQETYPTWEWMTT